MQTSARQERLANSSAWGSQVAFDHFQALAFRRAAELRRTTGRRDGPAFGRWLKLSAPEWPWHYAHLKAIRRALARVERGEVTRLAIFLHPRSFKSQMVTVRYPAYLLERDPLTRIIVGSHNQSLAESFSRETRRIVAERGVYLDPARQAADEWLTAAGGGLKAVGLNGSPTGRGANVFVIDDPVKSYQAARSMAEREHVWHWWQSDIISRLEPHPRTGAPGAVILIMTRWHEDDLAGRILTGEGGDQWEVLRIPALAETQEERDAYNASIGRPAGEPEPLGRAPGQAMNPERFDEATLAARRAEGGLLAFMALYQQRPSAPEGDMFRRAWFEVVDAQAFALARGAARSAAAVRYWDKAGSAGAGAYSAGVLMVKLDETYYVTHVVMGQWGAAEREAVIRQTATADFAAWGFGVETVVEQEPGSGGKESAENTIRNLSGYRVAADRPTGDKTLRAEPLAAQAAVGRVKIVGGSWNQDYLDILAAFPGGAIKDAVDASSGAFARLARAAAARPLAGEPDVVWADEIFGV